MSGHTPGPWKLKGSGTITDADGELVATTGYRVRVGSDEDDSNARLITAAPKMHEYIGLLASSGDLQAKRIIEEIG